MYRALRVDHWAHPRVCGENLLAVCMSRVWLGSSPRVRGKPARRPHRGHRPRLIPACAGKTFSRTTKSSGAWAHPRVCGENEIAVLVHGCVPGSSPRVRGKRDLGALLPAPARLIPACAGKTARTCSSTGARRLIPACAGKTGRRGRSPPSGTAHPRVCGENPSSLPSNTILLGSSPRVRGKLRSRARPGVPVRLIPACAGKT